MSQSNNLNLLSSLYLCNISYKHKQLLPKFLQKLRRALYLPKHWPFPSHNKKTFFLKERFYKSKNVPTLAYYNTFSHLNFRLQYYGLLDYRLERPNHLLDNHKPLLQKEKPIFLSDIPQSLSSFSCLSVSRRSCLATSSQVAPYGAPPEV